MQSDRRGVDFEDCLLAPHILLRHADILGTAAALRERLFLLCRAQVRIRRVARLAQSVKCLLGDCSARDELRAARIVGICFLCGSACGIRPLRGRTNLLRTVAALRPLEARLGMSKRRLIAQNRGIQITPADACRCVAGTHRHPLLKKELLDVAALLRADLHPRRLDRPREELRAQLLRCVFAKEQNDPCHLHLHAALSFPQNHIILYSISLECAQRN